jgi:hypothetical protein
VGTVKQQELCKDRVSEIEPTIRFCNFNLGQASDPETVKKILLETEASHVQDMLKSKLDVRHLLYKTLTLLERTQRGEKKGSSVDERSYLARRTRCYQE